MVNIRKNKPIPVFVAVLFLACTTYAQQVHNPTHTPNVVHIQQGVPAPYDGILLTIPDAAELFERAKLAPVVIKIWKQWANDYVAMVRKAEQETCKYRTEYWRTAYQDMAKHKQPHGLPWWAVTAIAVGALGLGVGVGIYLDRR